MRPNLSTVCALVRQEIIEMIDTSDHTSETTPNCTKCAYARHAHTQNSSLNKSI